MLRLGGESVAAADLRIYARRATMRTDTAYASAVQREQALKHLDAAAAVFGTCGACAPQAEAVREQNRHGARVSLPSARRGSDADDAR